ncbi:MAG TPA: PatB family C-S lyase [Anaerolineaceae bacterium]|nr:PatB family C-S lyase [Anaerolineaceae bacterium]HOV05698.1 PatB family C-S lyase [Anaerolineaceae bacterium]
MIESPERRGTDSVKWGLYEKDVLPLWVADMDFVSPPAVIAALQQRVDHGVFGYAMESKELKELILARMEKLYQWKIKLEDIVLLPGVVAAFNLVCQAVTSPGESILIQPPVYPPFFQAPRYAGARTVVNEVRVKDDGKYGIDFEDFESALEKDTRCFLLCNPHNPIGRVYTRQELHAMAEICLRHNMVICSDEIHSDLVYPGASHVPIASIDAEIANQTVTLIAPSKTYNIAGLECSALICTNAELREKIQHARRGLLGGVNALGMIAGAAAYREGDDWLREVMAVLESNRDFLMGYLAEKLPAIKMIQPEATYLAWLDCRELNLPVSPAKYFLEHARVAVNAGEDFGKPGEGFVRLNFGCTRSTLLEALERMRRVI